MHNSVYAHISSNSLWDNFLSGKLLIPKHTLVSIFLTSVYGTIIPLVAQATGALKNNSENKHNFINDFEVIREDMIIVNND